MEGTSAATLSQDDASIRSRLDNVSVEDGLIQLLMLSVTQARRIYWALKPEKQTHLRELFKRTAHSRNPAGWLNDRYASEPDKFRQVARRIELFDEARFFTRQRTPEVDN